MTFKLGPKSLANSKRVHPDLLALAHAAVARSEVDFGFAREQTRTVAEQRELVRRGVSKTMQSNHLPQPSGYSEALDCTAWVNGAFDHETWDHYYAIAAAWRDAAVERGIRVRWGGVWDRALNDLPAGAEAMKAAVAAYVQRRKKLGKNAFLDGPHFEFARGL